MSDSRPASTHEPQSTQPAAADPEADQDEQEAGEQSAETGRRPRSRIALDFDP